MQDETTKYTVIRIEDEEHRQKLQHYLEEHKDLKKSSFCRFYLRGLCIMKSQCCKFAHDFDQLFLDEEEYKKLSLMDCSISDRQSRKKMFIQKTDFHQRPLFFIKHLDYTWLYRYQFSQRYKKSGNSILTVEEINKNQPARNRIREIMHRQQWDKFLNFIEERFPIGNYTISMFSVWFARFGFQKSQTMCKFNDLLRYMTNVRNYIQAYIIMPPLTTRSVYLIKNKDTYLYEMIDAVNQDNQEYRTQMKKKKEERLKQLPNDLRKRFVCRFYMAGNCEFSRSQCYYVHEIEDMQYDKDQQFQKKYRQFPKSMEDRRNYISLFNFYNQHKTEEQDDISLQEVNSKFGVKDAMRRRVHLRLYGQFLNKLEQEYQLKILPLSLVKKEYVKFGFNHTDQNKFGQLQQKLWDLGYHLEQVLSLKGEKTQYVYRIPPLQQMNKLYFNKIKNILSEQLEGEERESNDQILQSSVRRLIYSRTDKNAFQIPLHVYLRKKGKTLKQILQQFFPQFTHLIFFESGQQNFKKLMDLLKKYFKKHKKFVYKLDSIDSHIRGLGKQQINLNGFVNFKSLLELALLQLGKQVYAWPYAGATLVLDRSHQSQQEKEQITNKSAINPLKIDELKLKQIQRLSNVFNNSKILVVDNKQSYELCRLVLQQCWEFGVDLQGKLSNNGYIDFIQISCILDRKYIFVIDIYLLNKKEYPLYLQVQTFLKTIFQSKQKLKIMHSCHQDSLALSYCMGITLTNVFDTSAAQIYHQQIDQYRQMHHHNHTFEHTLRKIHLVKAPGLNQVLEKWKAPNGINQYKEQMKKIFNEAPRAYFTDRPIIPQFLNYSARDVEDLIQVYHSMQKQDKQGIWRIVGDIFASIN